MQWTRFLCQLVLSGIGFISRNPNPAGLSCPPRCGGSLRHPGGLRLRGSGKTSKLFWESEMRTILSLVLVLLFCGLSYGQSDLYQYSSQRPLGDLRANPYSSQSLQNRFGAGSPYKTDGLRNPYSVYGSSYSNYSANNPYATAPPKIYSSSGTYHGNLSTNRFDADSTSNPYGRYGSRYSSESINNIYGAGNRYSSGSLYIYPSK